MTQTIRTALAAAAATALVASCGTSPQPRTAEVGGAAHKAARYHTLQTDAACACNAAFATAEGLGIGSTTHTYATTFGVVDASSGDLAQVQVAIYDRSRTPADLSLFGNSEGDVTIAGPIVTITSVLIRSAGQYPGPNLVPVVITLDASTGVLNLTFNNVPTFTGPAVPYGVIPGSCLRPPFLPIPEPPDDTM